LKHSEVISNIFFKEFTENVKPFAKDVVVSQIYTPH